MIAVSARIARVVLLAAILAPACSDSTREATPTDAGADETDETDAATTPLNPPDAGTFDSGQLAVECPMGTTVEFEDNGTRETATQVDGLSLCGAISPGSDVDYSKFSTPPGKKLLVFQAVIDGRVTFELRVGGKTLGPADVSSFEPGDYVVKAFTTDGKPGKYQYRIQVER